MSSPPGETVFMCGSGSEAWLRPSDIGTVALAIPTAQASPRSPGLCPCRYQPARS
jgi:hypothetical protein